MAEGATLPWKVQKLNLAPSLSYNSIHKPLLAPKGRRWNYDPVNKEWSLVAAGRSSYKPPIVENAKAIAVDEDVPTTTEELNSDPLPFVVYFVTPSDTFQGICLKYKITPLELRRANGGFTGENLSLAPNPLKIPCKDGMAASSATNEVQADLQPLNQSQVVAILVRECRDLSRSEARAYLMLNEWNFDEALQNAHDDGF